jgi:hypothetical protein
MLREQSRMRDVYASQNMRHHALPPAAPTYSTIASDGPRAYPVQEAFARVGIGVVKGYELIHSGELSSFLIGRKRYVTAEALRQFIDRQIQRSLTETAETRSGKVTKAVAARARRRAEARAA